MNHLDQVNAVRDAVRQAAADLGVATESWTETFLLRDSIYVGRRFRFGGMKAVWFCDQDEVELLDASGAVVSKLGVPKTSVEQSPDTIPMPQPAAAPDRKAA